MACKKTCNKNRVELSAEEVKNVAGGIVKDIGDMQTNGMGLTAMNADLRVAKAGAGVGVGSVAATDAAFGVADAVAAGIGVGGADAMKATLESAVRSELAK